MKKRIAIILFILAACIAGVASYFNFESVKEFVDREILLEKKHEEVSIAEEFAVEEEDEHSGEDHHDLLVLSEEQIENAKLEFTSASSGILEVILIFPGKIVINSEHFAHVVTKAPGIVRTAQKNMGDRVQKGELLAVIESKEMAEAKASYLSSKTQCELAESIFKSEQNLKDKGIAAKQEFLQAKAAATQALMSCALAKQKLLALGMLEKEIEVLPTQSVDDLLVHEIHAPFSGTIVSRHLTPGEVVSDTQEAYVIADLSTVWLELGIYPKDLAYVHENQVVELTNNSGQKAKAIIVRMSPVVDSDSGRGTAIAILDNPTGCWRPGCFVSASLVVEKIKVPILVAQDSVVRIDNLDYVFVKHSEGFEKRLVNKGRSDDLNVELVSGLASGEDFVSKNAVVLKFELTKAEPE